MTIKFLVFETIATEYFVSSFLQPAFIVLLNFTCGTFRHDNSEFVHTENREERVIIDNTIITVCKFYFSFS